MNYSEDGMAAIVEKDRQFGEFFQEVAAFQRQKKDDRTRSEKWGEKEKALYNSYVTSLTP